MRLVFLCSQTEYGEGERSSPVAGENKMMTIASGGDSWGASSGSEGRERDEWTAAVGTSEQCWRGGGF